MLFYCLIVLTVLWFCLITWLSHQNGSGTNKVSRNIAERLGMIFHNQDLNRLNGTLRRLAHIVVFAILTALVLLTMNVGHIERRWIAICVIILWALIDEATKPLIQGRHFSWIDVGLNLIGVGIGSILLVF